MILLLGLLLVILFLTYQKWFPFLVDLHTFLKMRKEFVEWLTGYYSVPHTRRYYRHVFPAGEIHIEDEEGTCSCKPVGTDETTRDGSDTILYGRVYFHRKIGSI